VHSRQALKLLKAAAKEAGIDTDFILSTDLESGALVQVSWAKVCLLKRISSVFAHVYSLKRNRLNVFAARISRRQLALMDARSCIG